MYVCVCRAVTEDQVQTAIEGGATTREAVTRACGAGSDCGACHGMIATMIEDHQESVTAPVLGRESVPGHRLVAAGALVRTRAA